MNIDDAIHALVSASPGGAEALAPRMNEKPAVFRSKANPNIDTHYFRPRQLVEMQTLSGRRDVLIAMASELNCIVIEQDIADAPEDVIAAITRLSSEFSDVLKVATDTIKDGDFSANDRKRVQRELIELINCANALLPALEKVKRHK
ncbi:MAG TPA: phage regulatory CII family protein [Rhodocyclaceae bacterium]|jgi:hypothetical protein|nr:phage regulatory CII family protein [Rhodocyclaceae bacterium]